MHLCLIFYNQWLAMSMSILQFRDLECKLLSAPKGTAAQRCSLLMHVTHTRCIRLQVSIFTYPSLPKERYSLSQGSFCKAPVSPRLRCIAGLQSGAFVSRVP